MSTTAEIKDKVQSLHKLRNDGVIHIDEETPQFHWPFWKWNIVFFSRDFHYKAI